MRADGADGADGEVFWSANYGRLMFREGGRSHPVRWLEYRMPRNMTGAEVRHEALRFAGPRRAHCFHDEPWHPGAWVVRVKVDDWTHTGPATEWQLATGCVVFDDGSDPIGEWGLQAMDAALRYSSTWPWPYSLRKLIHCVLNQAGYTRRGEVVWALDYAWRSAAMLVLEPLQRHRPALASRAAGLLRRVPGPRGRA